MVGTIEQDTRAGARRGRLGEGRRCVSGELRRNPRRGRRGLLRLRGRPPRRRRVGRTRRSRGEPSVGRGHHRRRRLHDQRRDRDLRPSAGPARRARSRRPRGRVLARVRRCRQGADPGALAALAPGRPAGRRRTADLRGRLRLASGHPGARGAEAGVAAGHRARLPQHDLRVPGRGARAADHRQVARHLLRRGGRRPARAERLDRAARGARGTGGPDRVRRSVHAGGDDRRDDRDHRPRSGHGHRLDERRLGPGLRASPRQPARRRLGPRQRLHEYACVARRRAPRAPTCSRTLDRWPGCMRPR